MLYFLITFLTVVAFKVGSEANSIDECDQISVKLEQFFDKFHDFIAITNYECMNEAKGFLKKIKTETLLIIGSL